MSARILITGAGGFLGMRVVRAALTQGHHVRALMRRPCNGPTHDHLEIAIADLRDRDATVTACRDIDVVIHLAACVAGTPQQQFQSTVAGTESLLFAMDATGVSRLVLASSFYVYDFARTRRRLTEASPVLERPYHRDGYTTAKWWQEKICRSWAERDSHQLTVLRPGYIWGADNPVAPRLGFSLAGRFIVVGPFADPALTHVDNCAEYFVGAIREDVTGETFNVVDGHRMTHQRVTKDLAKYVGRYSTQGPGEPNSESSTLGLDRRVWLPYWCGAALSRLAGLSARMLWGPKYRLPSLLMPALFQARFRPLRSPATKLQNAFGPPRWTYAQCLERTFLRANDDRIDRQAEGHPPLGADQNSAAEGGIHSATTAADASRKEVTAS